MTLGSGSDLDKQRRKTPITIDAYVAYILELVHPEGSVLCRLIISSLSHYLTVGTKHYRYIPNMETID